MKAKAIAFHGWGFDTSCWRSWTELLQCRGIMVDAYDRGYYGQPQETAFTGSPQVRIVLAHSFGLHLCPLETRLMADLLFIFSGFTRFHPDSGPAKRRSERLYAAMCDRFTHEPRTVLDTFLERCDCPESARPDCSPHLNIDLLQRDLHDLVESTLPQTTPNVAQTALIFHGTDDRIVPVAKGRELASHYGTRAHYFEIKNAGHALPFTHAEHCMAHIEPFLKDVGLL